MKGRNKENSPKTNTKKGYYNGLRKKERERVRKEKRERKKKKKGKLVPLVQVSKYENR